MGLDDDIFEDDGKPVNRRECSLLRQAINSRVGGIERDISEIKYEQRIMKECIDKFFATQEEKWGKLFYYIIRILLIVVAILILVLAGRFVDLDLVMGMIP